MNVPCERAARWDDDNFTFRWEHELYAKMTEGFGTRPSRKYCNFRWTAIASTKIIDNILLPKSDFSLSNPSTLFWLGYWMNYVFRNTKFGRFGPFMSERVKLWKNNAHWVNSDQDRYRMIVTPLRRRNMRNGTTETIRPRDSSRLSFSLWVNTEPDRNSYSHCLRSVMVVHNPNSGIAFNMSCQYWSRISQ